ncbi:MAG: purine-nucleoside phosphorylase [Deltaproteobacteria bacterium]|nr:purine-nucleoside phosphorylase [Deltaproteobacteria bacterium]MBW2110572.1 purine-nucleoside phosphorylase [Deltaproteobacteria bacterium]MBW2352135.1 purine-nucleoside phosphorylase [Deltaproteobacteria bacterium]HDZ90423.1 purine-nucleoside phosphorylase [Deltaproteobacteria bacterium]
MLEKIRETADFLRSKLVRPPLVGMITGTGLGEITERIMADLRIPYREIPNFPHSTVEGHKGVLAAGTFAGRSIMAMEGRFHLYEGYSPYEVTFPVRVMAELGVRYLLMSSAAGGLNPHFLTGDLMIITDHINLKGVNPLQGPDLGGSFPRFPDMSRVYPSDLVGLARKTAVQMGVLIREGVYVGVLGPSLETPAETRFLRMIGADAVGMSTVSQAIVGVHCGLKILGIVVITNVNRPDCMEEISMEDVIAVARKASSVLSDLWKGIIGNLPED